MTKTELYILIAVFLFLTVALVWTGAKMWLNVRKRRQNGSHRGNRTV